MSNASQSLWITYNGEVYNGPELRRELEALGCVFRSTGDTEIIVAGYEVWGESVLERLRGMFALAIWDTRAAPRLVLARDPLGIKPLYYSTTPTSLGFASECRGLMAMGLADQEISPAGLTAYLQFGSVPAPLTMYRGVHALEAGSILTVDIDTDGPRLRRPRSYWSLPDGPQSVPGGHQTAGEQTEQLRTVLRDSVKRHLVSDVPLGVFLSGGLDSAALVALMRAASPSGEIRTCTVVFEDGRYDESEYAHQVAHAFGTQHMDVPMSSSELARDLDQVLTALDQPSNDGINIYVVSQAARQAGLTVALSGLGGDELFGGYPTFRRFGPLLRAARWSRRIPSGADLFEAALRARGTHAPTGRLAGWLSRAGAEPAAVYLGLRGLFSQRAVANLVQPDVLQAAGREFDALVAARSAARLQPGMSPRELVSRFELTWYMRHQLLRDTDAMSMAHSLEVRVPFVDRCVVAHVLGQRLARQAGPLPKQPLRDALPELPPAVRARRDKQGFTFPFGPWLSGPLRPQLEELVHASAAQLRPFLRPGACEQVLAEFDQGRAHWSRPWSLAALATTTRQAPLLTTGVD